MKPTNEFFETLGQYVYKYEDDGGDILYIGKGKGDRCLWHLKDKGYEIKHCYIVARNLEKFENKKDWQSFLLESFLLATQFPQDNSVAGHYKECFIMLPLSSIWQDYQSVQHDNFAVFPEWYVENYDQLRGKMRMVQILSGSVFIESGFRNSTKMSWTWEPHKSDVKVTFETANTEEEKVEAFRSNLTTWLKNQGYKKLSGENRRITFSCPTIEQVIELFVGFNS